MVSRTSLMSWVALALALLAARAQESAAPKAPDAPIHTRIDLPSVAACGGCHLEAYAEWSRSLHARAWTNANVQTATDGFRKGTCRACHSPEPVLESGLDARPDYRDHNQEDGVHCLSCHGLADGVAAARTIPDAPCKPRFDARLRDVRLCYPCHEPTHGAFEEYERSDAKAVGLRCADCHMPPRADAPGHDHGPNGGLNPDFVRRALAWSCAIEDGALVLELRNRTGHRFPGEIPSRSFVVKVAFDARAAEVITLRKAHKGEQRDENRLEPDETRVLRFPFPADARSVSVRLLFLPLPLLPEEQAFVLGEWSGAR